MACGMLEDQLLDFDVIGADAIVAAEVDDEYLVTPGAEYELIIVPEMRVMKASVARKLLEYREGGGRIVFLGGAPALAVDGSRSVEFVEMFAELLEGSYDVRLSRDQDSLVDAFGGSSARSHVMEFDGFSAAYRGGSYMTRLAGRRMIAGTVLTVPEQELGPYSKVLGATAGRTRIGSEKPLEGVRLMTRAVDDVTLHLLVNERREEAACPLLLTSDVPLRLEAWDPDTGRRETLADHEDVTDTTEVDVTLGPFGSVVLVAMPPDALEEPAADDRPDLISTGEVGRATIERPVRGYEIVNGMAVESKRLPMELGRGTPGAERGWWHKIEAYEDFSGTVEYRLDFDLPRQWEQGRIVLDLTDVSGVAEVWINGQHAGKCLWAPHEFEVGELLRGGANEVTIHITNTLANQALREDVMQQAKDRGWWNPYRERTQSMMEEALPSGMDPVVRVWWSVDEVL